MQPDQQQRIMGYFIEEAKDHLNTIEQGLLKLQATLQDPEMVNEVFRAAHSIKGGAAMLGLGSIQKVSHRLEDFFKLLKETPIRVDQKLENLFLKTFDALQELVGQLQGPFGLTEEAGNNIIAGVEPTFDELEQHLTLLAGLTGEAMQPIAVGAVPSRVPLEQAFRNEVPGQLRDMLQLFKQAETDEEGRQQLQEYCRSLASLGASYGLTNWCALLETARRAIAHPGNSYRSLAPIIIKDIKQGQEQVLAHQATNISACSQLQELAALYDQSISQNTLDDLLIDADLTSVDEASIFDDQDIFGDPDIFNDQLDDNSLDLDLGFDNLESTTTGELDFSSFDAQVFDELPDHRNGPEVGTAELNSLADLFEGEVPDLGLTWQEEEVFGDTSDLLSSNYGLGEGDSSVDFSDLLFEETATDSLSSIDDGLDALFDEGVEDEARDSFEAEPISDAKSPVLPQADSDEFADLLQIQPSEISHSNFLDLDASLDLGETGYLAGENASEGAIQPEDFDNLGDLFDEVGTAEENALAATRQEDFDNLGDLFDQVGTDSLEIDELGIAGLQVDELGPTDSIPALVPDPWSEISAPVSNSSTLGELSLDDADATFLENFAIPEDLDFGDSISSLTEISLSQETAAPNAPLENSPHSAHELTVEPASEAVDSRQIQEASQFPIPDPWGEVGMADSLSLDDLSLDSLDLAHLLSDSDAILLDGPDQEVIDLDVDALADSESGAVGGEVSSLESDLLEVPSDAEDSDSSLESLFGDSSPVDTSSAESVDSWFDTMSSSDELIVEDLGFGEGDFELDLPQSPFEEGAIADLSSSPLDTELEWPSPDNAGLSDSNQTLDDEFSLNFSDPVSTETVVDEDDLFGENVAPMFDFSASAVGEDAIDPMSTETVVDEDDLFGESVAPMFDFSASSAAEGGAITAFGEDEEATQLDANLFGLENEFSLEDISQPTVDNPESSSDLDDLFAMDSTALHSDDAEELDLFNSNEPLSELESENSINLEEFSGQDFTVFQPDQLLGGDDFFSSEAPSEASDELLALDNLLDYEAVSSNDQNIESADLASDPALFSFDVGEEIPPPDLNGFDELDLLLENGLASSDLPNLLTDISPAIQPEEDLSFTGLEMGLGDFSDLEALLDVDPASPVSSSDALSNEPFSDSLTVENPPFPSSTGDSEFDDLDDLLKDAEEKMGGSPSVSVGRGIAPQARRTPRPGKVFSEQTMRVPVKHLDNLSNLVGELVVNRNSLEQDQERLRQSLDNLLYQVQQLSDVGQRMQDLYERSLLESSLLASRHDHRSTSFTSGMGRDVTTVEVSHSNGMEYDPLEMDRFTGFHSLSQEMIELIVRVRESSSDIEFIVDETEQVTRMFRQVTTQLQEGLTRSRMVPFAQTADRLPRAVRDISMKVGKQAELVIEGRETLIDKMILEQLYDPMTHLVNNAITHGIESPEIRQAAGKPAAGRIVIRAFHQGNQTIISVSDDGAGIDVDRVKAKAVEKGLLTPEEARSLSRLDVYDILFHPGFTTKDQADDYSGRGVGMDVVRTSLSEIRGVINTDSNTSKGTTFTIRLPLTLSISKALCCISDRARIAFPMDGVEDMIDIPKDRIQTNAEGQPCIAWRDTVLPLRPLSELLAYNRYLSRGNVYGGNQEDDIVSIVVLRSAGNFLALQVDQVLGEQEIVIKQLEGPVPKPLGVAGATVLGDGRIMPIADVLELIDLSMGRIRRDAGVSLWEQSGSPMAQEPAIAKTEPMVLIVDDSITVRELLSMTFNKVGYRVEQARDGQEAWEKLRSGLPCDIVFCDIEMPRMDGLELLSRIQKDPNLQHLPIAMLTSRGADRHRQMASSLGASGYFTKPYLEEALLDAAQRMLKGERLLNPSG